MKIIPHSRPTLGNEEINSLRKVFRSGILSSHAEVDAFQKELSLFIGVKAGVAASSGTAALFLALRALRIKKDDEVILPSFVCTAVLNAVLEAGAIPVLAECAENDFNVSAQDIRKKTTRRTKAVIVPHMFGRPADMKAITALGLPVIEDCAQTLGVPCQGKNVGQWGAIAVCSFYTTKLLATGEGGMVLSSERHYIDAVRDIIEYDEKDDLKPRFNFKMTDLQAAIGRVQLKKLPGFLKKRAAVAKLYSEALSNSGLTLPSASRERGHAFFRYVVTPVKNRDKALRAFEKRGISARKPLYKPLHRYLKLNGFPQAEERWHSSLSLPLYPSLERPEAERIAQTAARILRNEAA